MPILMFCHSMRGISAHVLLVSGPRKVNKQGGGREGYAVAAEVLDDDWQDDYEDLAHEDEDEGEAFDCGDVCHMPAKSAIHSVLAFKPAALSSLAHVNCQQGDDSACMHLRLPFHAWWHKI